ncbi:hypothetical protein [Streptomyces doebereineriae]|uniref:Uncharacterized protein n=1 Tax=Streptomyces doebereineriae TaxID=3075528 RepID=A0ABU2VAP8_9ACTN|nr:hypothetical protein [Streptomyces sp. DSM 41640]MDT0482625.1 hypothetical protein [Streptomyces sp. DSM 41640]
MTPTLNSVVARSSGLTAAGTYIEMTSRLTEPLLLGLAGTGLRRAGAGQGRAVSV